MSIVGRVVMVSQIKMPRPYLPWRLSQQARREEPDIYPSSGSSHNLIF
jgi:hypothetical protein